MQHLNYLRKNYNYLITSSLNTYGYSGSIQFLDALCFLPQNNINEKVFIFLYFWYIFAAIFGALNLIYLFVMFGFKFMRAQDVRRIADCDRTRRSDEICYWGSDFGIWHVLRIIHRNLNPVLFEDFIRALVKCDDVKSLNYSVTSEDLDMTDGDLNKRGKQNVGQV